MHRGDTKIIILCLFVCFCLFFSVAKYCEESK